MNALIVQVNSYATNAYNFLYIDGPDKKINGVPIIRKQNIEHLLPVAVLISNISICSFPDILPWTLTVSLSLKCISVYNDYRYSQNKRSIALDIFSVAAMLRFFYTTHLVFRDIAIITDLTNESIKIFQSFSTSQNTDRRISLYKGITKNDPSIHSFTITTTDTNILANALKILNLNTESAKNPDQIKENYEKAISYHQSVIAKLPSNSPLIKSIKIMIAEAEGAYQTVTSYYSIQ